MRQKPATIPSPAMLTMVLIGITLVSQFHRASLAVIAPELLHELALTPRSLGLAGGMFFLVLVVAQVPVGVLLDSIGPRRLVAWLTGVACLGALLSAAATDAGSLILARGVVGLGCAAYFMAAVLMCSRWFRGPGLSTALSRVFAMSQIGTLLAGWPLAQLSETIGWRSAFVLSALLTALAGALFVMLVRQEHPDSDAEDRNSAAPAASLSSALQGLREVVRTPGLIPILAIHSMAYAVFATVLGLWAGPYLHDVHGLDAVSRGQVMAAMTVAQIIGILAYGPLDARLNTRKGVILTGGLATLSLLTLMALWANPPLSVAITLLVLLCATSSYSVTIVAHGRSLFPDRLLGRGMTTLNLAQVTGASLLPILTGWIAASMIESGAGGYSEVAYRAIWAVIATGLACGLVVYSRARDARPRP